jgi:hypothetical protein
MKSHSRHGSSRNGPNLDRALSEFVLRRARVRPSDADGSRAAHSDKRETDQPARQVGSNRSADKQCFC